MSKINFAKLPEVVFMVAVLCVSNAFARSDVNMETRIYDFPALDFPYNNGRAPSMKQSLQLSNDFTYWLHNSWLDLVAEEGSRDWMSQELPIYLIDSIVASVPLGAGWLHEEWHRAVLGRRGISSYNGIYDLSFAKTVAVSRVRDEELSVLKRDYPQEMVRLHSAGFEAQFEQSIELEKQSFFNNHAPVIESPIAFNHLNTILYMHMCTSKMGDALIDSANRSDGANVSSRDFTGPDCTAWVYDLFRPDEAYSARGVHPSGVGINRYRKWTGLNVDEQRYLTRQRNLSWLNLADPMMFGYRDFSTSTGDWYWNANLRHVLTPFGYDIAANVFLKSRDDLDIFSAVHTYHNDKASSLGLDVTLLRYPTILFEKSVHVTPRLFAWMQPENLMFRDAVTALGGLVAIRVDVPIESGWEVYAEWESKSKGWVAGNEYLDGQMAMRFGLTKVIEAPSRWKTIAPVAKN